MKIVEYRVSSESETSFTASRCGYLAPQTILLKKDESVFTNQAAAIEFCRKQQEENKEVIMRLWGECEALIAELGNYEKLN